MFFVAFTEIELIANISDITPSGATVSWNSIPGKHS